MVAPLRGGLRAECNQSTRRVIHKQNDDYGEMPRKELQRQNRAAEPEPT